MNLRKILLVINTSILTLLIAEIDKISYNESIIYAHILNTFIYYFLYNRNSLGAILLFTYYLLSYLSPYVYLVVTDTDWLFLIPKYKIGLSPAPLYWRNLLFSTLILLFARSTRTKKVEFGNVIGLNRNSFWLILLASMFFHFAARFLSFPFYGYLYLFTNPQFVVFFIFAAWPQFSKEVKVLVYLYLLLYLVFTLTGGSRSGIVNLIIYGFAFYADRIKDDQIRISTLVLGLGGSIAAIFSYPIATAIRISSDSGRRLDWNSIWNIYSQKNIELALGFIMKRVSMLDIGYALHYSLYIPDKVAPYFKANYTLKSAINLVLPGSLYDNYLSSCAYLRVIMFDVSPTLIAREWTSYSAWIFDFGYLYFGRYALLITSFLMIVIFKISDYSSNRIRRFSFYSLALSYLYFNSILFFGIDYAIKILIHAFIACFGLKIISILTVRWNND